MIDKTKLNIALPQLKIPYIFTFSCSLKRSRLRLVYKVKKEQPASKKQKEVLRELLKYHRINLSAQIDSLSKNEISRLTDQIIAQHGRMQKR